MISTTQSFFYKKQDAFKVAITLLFSLLISFSFAQDDLNNAIEKLKTSTNNDDRLNYYTTILQHYASANADSLDYYSKLALDEFKTNKYVVGIADINLGMAFNYSYLGRLKLSEIHAQAGLEAARSINYVSSVGKAYSILGVLNAKKENYVEANNLVFKALNIFLNEPKIDTHKIISTYIKLGLINTNMSLYENSRSFYNKGLELAEQMNSNSNKAQLYTNISVLFGKQAQLDSAEFYLLKSLEISENINDKYTNLLNYNNLGNIYLQRDQPQKAIEYYNKSLKIAYETNNQEEAIRAKLNILEVSSLPFKTKLDSLNALLELVKNEDLYYFVQEILYTKMDVYEDYGNFKAAYETLKEIYHIKDSLVVLRDIQEIEEVKAIHEVEQAKAALIEMQNENEREKEVRNTIIGFLVFVFLAALTLLFVLKRKNDIHKKLLLRELELQRLNDSKNRLFSILGHDLRGPIGSIMSLIEITINQSEAQRNEHLEILSDLSSSVFNTLNNILEWGKSQMKGETLSLEKFNAFNETITSTRLFSDALKRKKLDLRTTIDATIDLHFDLNHFHLILRNLISNAIKFTNEGGSIEIGTIESDHPDFITFYVKDSGVGIKPAKLNSIFDDYWDSSDGTANEKGSGLGLLLCKSYIEEGGGKIWVESKVDSGSTFYFSIKHS